MRDQRQGPQRKRRTSQESQASAKDHSRDSIDRRPPE